MFSLQATDPRSRARAGTLRTGHGEIHTPIFMPVGTQGSVKGVQQSHLENEIGAEIILGNTYHLYLRPGRETLQAAGGLHGFMHWDKPILTDSGGFQVYSLTGVRKLKEEGVTFQSHIDGSKHLFTPENVVDTQRMIGSDIMMVLDECTPWPCDYTYAKRSLGLTHRWADRCRERFEQTQPLHGHPQFLFPIVQGSVYRDLRIESAKTIAAMDFPGNAIGGLSVGEPAEIMYEMTETVTEYLPEHKPRYLMGVGTPANLLECIARGIDMFDCVMPTRNARHGFLFTWNGIRNLRNARYKEDFSPIDEASKLWTDRHYSKAYLRHLLVCGELLGVQLATMHNLHFYLDLVKEARRHILKGTFSDWKAATVPILQSRI